jgi:hypothetical protein
VSEQRDVELDAGPITYLDSGGNGRPLVLLHGLLMDAGQVLITENWDERVGRIVFASCGTYHNYPPGLPRGAREIAQFVSGTVPTELGQ